MSLSKQDAAQAMLERLKNYKHGYWLTLDAKTAGSTQQRFIELDKQLGQFAQRMNSYCLGRKYRRGDGRLMFAGAIEVGNCYERTHAHLVMMHGGEVTRSFEQIELEVRKQWYDIVGARGYETGNLVNVQLVGDVSLRISYALKNFRSSQDAANRLVVC
jgi:hypothetical protein